MYKLAFILFLLLAAAWDLLKKEVPLGLYLCGALLAVLTRGFGWLTADGCFSIGIGIGLLFLTLVSGGRIGAGDGMFFLVSGMYLECRVNAALFFYGLMLCCIYCLWAGVYSRIKYQQIQNKTVPFLPFLVPVGVWLTTGGGG